MNEINFVKNTDFSQVPFITEGYFNKEDLVDLIPDISAYGHESAEGIVIKKYSKKEYKRIKLVKPEFVKTLDDENEHWSHKQLKRNKLNG